MALSGDTALVGAYYDDVGANADQGSAYVFTRSGTTWTQQAQLTASDGAAGDCFGTSVALSGDTALVGAISDDVGANSGQGSAYVFTRNGTTWTQQAKLTASDGAAYGRLWQSVALSGDTALVGATYAGGLDQGAAYVFTRSRDALPKGSNACGRPLLDRWNGFGTDCLCDRMEKGEKIDHNLEDQRLVATRT